LPPHPVLVKILQKFRAQLHQLMPNMIGRIDKSI
jgi:hypothetical protein